ncbi:hypothetical protein GGG16DRAFT_59362 [Schizophyllum commune]
MEAPAHAHAIPSPEGLRRTPTDSRRNTIDPRRIPMDPDGVYTQQNGFRTEAAHMICASACAPDSALVHRRFASTSTERRTGLEIMANVLEKLDQVGEVVRLASEVVARAGGCAANAHVSSPLHNGSSRAVPQARHSVSNSRSPLSRAGGSTSPATSSVSYASTSSYASAHPTSAYLHPDVARHPSPTAVTRSSHASIPPTTPNITRLLNFFIARMKRSPDAVVPHVCRSAPLVSSPAILVALMAYVALNPPLEVPPVYSAQALAHAHDTPAPRQREAVEAYQLAFKCLAHYLVQCGEGRRDGRPEDAPTNRQEDSTHTHHRIRYPSQPPTGDPRQRSSADSHLSGDSSSRHRQNRRRNIWLAYLADLDDHHARAFVYDCTLIVHHIDSEGERDASSRDQGHNTTVYPGQGHHSIVNQGHYQTVSHGHYLTATQGQHSTKTQGTLALRRCLMDDALYVARRLQQRGVALSELYCGSELLRALR